MVIVKPSREKVCWIVNLGLFCGALGAAVGMLLFSLEPQKRLPNLFLERRTLFLGEIGFGPLGLNGVREPLPVSGLARELVVLGKNSRPDREEEATFLLGLKSAGEEQVVSLGQRVYLKQEGSLRFSKEKTALAVIPRLGERGQVSIDVDFEGKAGQFTFKPGKSREECAEFAFVKALRKAKCWGPDRFFEMYGGKEYQTLSHKHKLEFAESVCFVEPGDTMVWEKERWKVANNPPSHLPVAKVSSIDARGVRLEAWDETGFYQTSIEISSMQPVRLGYKAEELITSIRPRAASELSCVLGKRRVVLREGDWWLKTATGWRQLRKLEEIEDFLEHKVRGELFVFETISMDHGKAVIKGNVFDEMRTQMQPIALAISTDKKVKVKQGAKETPLLAKTEEKKP